MLSFSVLKHFCCIGHHLLLIGINQWIIQKIIFYAYIFLCNPYFVLFHIQGYQVLCLFLTYLKKNCIQGDKKACDYVVLLAFIEDAFFSPMLALGCFVKNMLVMRNRGLYMVLQFYSDNKHIIFVSIMLFSLINFCNITWILGW